MDATTNRHPRASGDPAPFVPEAGPGSSAKTLGSRLRGNDSMGDRGSSLVPESPAILPLHGDLPVDQQAQVLQPDPRGSRRVVLATNVAASCVTLPGDRRVNDSGRALQPPFHSHRGFAQV